MRQSFTHVINPFDERPIDRPNLVYHETSKPMNGKDIINKLKANGWTLSRISGSHHIMVKAGLAVPVPVHGSRDVGPGLVSAIARQTGVKLK